MLRSHSLRWLLVAGIPLVLTAGASAQTKVGILNTQAALSGTAELKKAQTDLEAKYKDRQDQMAKLQKELDAINQQLSLGEKLTPQAQAELNAQGQRKSRDFQRLSEDLQADVERERTEILQRSSERMRSVVAKLAEEKGLDAVIDSSNTIYFKPALDITKEATEAYDKAYPAK
ncbi:MAG: OmpH family outer membrane protein [Bryobacteraceae bacterium]